MTRWFLLLVACVMASSAAAQTSSVPKEIVAFKEINVDLLGKINKCNVKDRKKLASNLQDKLGAIGVKQDPSSRIYATLRVAGNTFGVLSVLCNYSVNLSFQAWLTSNEINMANPRARAAIARLKVIPLTLWQSSVFGVTTLKGSMNPDAPGGRMQAQNAAMKGSDLLVEHFNKLRQ